MADEAFGENFVQFDYRLRCEFGGEYFFVLSGEVEGFFVVEYHDGFFLGLVGGRDAFLDEGLGL